MAECNNRSGQIRPRRLPYCIPSFRDAHWSRQGWNDISGIRFRILQPRKATKRTDGTSLLVPRLRMCLPVQGPQVRSLAGQLSLCPVTREAPLHATTKSPDAATQTQCSQRKQGVGWGEMEETWRNLELTTQFGWWVYLGSLNYSTFIYIWKCSKEMPKERTRLQKRVSSTGTGHVLVEHLGEMDLAALAESLAGGESWRKEERGAILRRSKGASMAGVKPCPPSAPHR